MAQNYSELQGHLNRVRWAWKRTAALQGLAVVVIEGIGMFLLFALLDYMYVLAPGLRVTSLVVIAALLAYLFARHVLRPLLKVIPDEQIALYIEERQQDAAGGALLSATAFGKDENAKAGPLYRFIVENIVGAAVQKAGGLQLSRVLDLSKLRKYGIAAAVVLLFFGITAFKFSDFFRSKTGRLLMPWQMTEEDLRASGAIVDSEPRIEFKLGTNPENGRVLRGSSAVIKATLSRMPGKDVFLMFRSKGNTEFQKLKMDEIEELNSFALRLPDINDDLEFHVMTNWSTGTGKHVSESANLAVFDRLEIQGYELTLTPPQYTKQAPSVVESPSGDILALVGTKVKVRALANTGLKKGEIVFDDGRKIPMTGEQSGAAAEFTIEKDGTYTVAVQSNDEQNSDPSNAFVIKVQQDEPPTLALMSPASDMAAHPQSEVDFVVKATDDVGIGSIELTYNLSQDNATSATVPFKLHENGPGEREYTLALPLAELKTLPRVGDTLFYHLTLKDLKGQPAVSDIFMLKVRPYEIAGAFPRPEPEHAHEPHARPMDLMMFIAAAWNLHTQKAALEKADFEGKCLALHSKMTLEDGSPRAFKKPKITKLPPDKQAMVKAGDEHLKKGLGLLKAADPGAAVAEMREALALWQRASTGFDMLDEAQAKMTGGAEGAQPDPMKDALGFMKMEIPMPEVDAGDLEATKLPEYRRAIKPDEAKELKAETEKLKKRQEELLEEAKKLAVLKDETAPEPKPGEKQDNNDPQTAENRPDQNKNEPVGEKKPDNAATPNNEAKGPNTQTAENKPQNNGAAPANENAPKEDPHAQKPEAHAGHGPIERRPEPPLDQRANPNSAVADADREARENELEKKQQQLAADTRRLAQKIASQVPNADKDTKAMIEHFRKSTKEMEEATRQIQTGNLQQAAARGEQARNELNKAGEKLQVSQFDTLEAAVEAAEERALAIQKTQKQINEQTNKIVEEARGRQQKEAAGQNKPEAPKTGDVKLNSQELQKLQGLAKLQVDTQKAAENLETYVNELAQRADAGNKKDTAEELKKAAKTMKQDDVAATMVTSAVAMGQQELGEAREAQTKLDKTLDKLTNNLQGASTALAQTQEQKLKRALSDAKDILHKVEQLTGEPTGDKKDGDPKTADGKKQDGKDGDPKTADGKKQEGKDGDPKTADGKKQDGKDGDPKTTDGKKQDGKDGDPKTTDGKKQDGKDGDPKTADGKKQDGKDGEQTADNKQDGKGEKTAANQKQGANKGKGDKDKKELSADEKRALAAEIQRATARLARRLEQDKLAEAPVAGQIKGLAEQNDKTFQEMFKDAQKTKLDGYLKSVKGVASHLEGKLESTLKAKRLSAAQREQTPAQYRDMVNKYYEALAKE